MEDKNLTREEEREQQAEVAMNIIVHAGDARNLIMESLELVSDGDFQAANKKLEEAFEEIRQAHGAQTDVIQNEASGKEYIFTILFCHAQDTLMTIYSEYNLAKKLLGMFEKFDKRVAALEGK